MVFVICGFNHDTAPIDVRERLTLSLDKEGLLLREKLDECVMLSTCNRTELYCITPHPQKLPFLLSQVFQCDESEFTSYLYIHTEKEAIRHLLRVASGLDSMMLGEPQILGQLKRAYLGALDAKMVKKKLRYIFQIIFRLAKKVRTESGIGNNPLSVAYAAAQLVAKHFNELSTQRIFLIGSGDTASLVLKYLAQKGGQHFTIANRTEEHAALLAARFHAKTLSITDIPEHLAHADVVISATTCPLPFITKNWIERALDERNHAPMLLLDLAIPRDIEANVAELEHVKLYNIDDFESMINEGLSERKLAAVRAETLIDVEMNRFVNWRQAAKADEMISQYRAQMKELAAKEIERAERRLSRGDCTHQVLLQLSERLVNKLTHIPTMSLRQAITSPDKDLLDLIDPFLTHQDHLPL